MAKGLMAVTALAAGTAAAGVMVYLQVTPQAFTSPEPPPLPRVTYTAPAPVVLETAPEVVEMAPTVITAPAPKPATGDTPLATNPCSGWRDLGPKASGTLEGDHRVRLLCM